MASSGIYSYLPLGLKVLRKINNIIRKHMDSSGAQEIFMSALQPMDIWRQTGRDKDLAEVMFKFKDRKGRELCLGPTHEEEVTEIARRGVSSYKQMPFILYQIQTKFRDEPRPRFGLMRSSEFIMKDAYSFDRDEAGLDKNYQKMLACYKDIFKACGLDFIISEADSGAMGGSVSHEFMVKSDIGEDTLFYCAACKKYFKDKKNCPACTSKLKEEKMIEIAHIFKLGTKYSLAQQALFLDDKGKRKPIIMGCYGIGVSRLLAAIAEVCSDDKGFIWPKGVSPYEATLAVLDDSLIEDAAKLAQDIEIRGLSVLVDERKGPAGVKFNDAYLIGNPYILIIGKNYLKNKNIDLEVRKTGEKFNLSKKELLNFLEKEYAV